MDPEVRSIMLEHLKFLQKITDECENEQGVAIITSAMIKTANFLIKSEGA